MNSDPFIDAVDEWAKRDEPTYSDKSASWLFFFKAGQASVAPLNVLKQARADALREAATTILAGGFDGWHHQPTLNDAANAILALIDQPQEEVCCEWVLADRHSGVWVDYDTGCGNYHEYRNGMKFCPYCGKPIKVKE